MRAGHAPIVLFIGACGRSRLIFGNSATTPVTARRVEEVFQRTGRVIELCVGGKLIRTTAEHPFYVQDKGWTAAKLLNTGDLLRSHGGQWLPVEATCATGEVVPVYNLRVEEYHTYFVGSEEWGFSIWVHNACSNATLRKQWEEANGQPWPKDPVTGNNQDVSHIVPKADGGANTLENIEPLPHDIHIQQHIDNGDFVRWGARGRGL